MNTNPNETLPQDEAELITPEQLAQRLNVSRRCLASWARDKIIPMVKIGRICRFDLRKVMAALAQYERRHHSLNPQCAACEGDASRIIRRTRSPAPIQGATFCARHAVCVGPRAALAKASSFALRAS